MIPKVRYSDSVQERFVSEDVITGASSSVGSSKGPDVFVFSGPLEAAGPSSVAGNRAHQKAFMVGKLVIHMCLVPLSHPNTVK